MSDGLGNKALAAFLLALAFAAHETDPQFAQIFLDRLARSVERGKQVLDDPSDREAIDKLHRNLLRAFDRVSSDHST